MKNSMKVLSLLAAIALLVGSQVEAMDRAPEPSERQQVVPPAIDAAVTAASKCPFAGLTAKAFAVSAKVKGYTWDPAKRYTWDQWMALPRSHKAAIITTSVAFLAFAAYMGYVPLESVTALMNASGEKIATWFNVVWQTLPAKESCSPRAVLGWFYSFAPKITSECVKNTATNAVRCTYSLA